MKYIYTITRPEALLDTGHVNDLISWMIKRSQREAKWSGIPLVEYTGHKGIENLYKGVSKSQMLIKAYSVMVKGVKDGPLAKYSGIPLSQIYSPVLDDSVLNGFMDALETNDENKALEWARWGIPLDVIRPWMSKSQQAQSVILAMDSGATPEFYSAWRKIKNKKKSESRLTRTTFKSDTNVVTTLLEGVDVLVEKAEMSRAEAEGWMLADWDVRGAEGLYKAGVTMKEAESWFAKGVQSFEGIIFAHENPGVPKEYVRSFFS